jgi:hypothetical protein
MVSWQSGQRVFRYRFSLEVHVPQDHLIRAIDRFVELGNIRNHLAPQGQDPTTVSPKNSFSWASKKQKKSAMTPKIMGRPTSCDRV